MHVLNQTFKIVDLALKVADPLLVLLILSIHFAELADRLKQLFTTGG